MKITKLILILLVLLIGSSLTALAQTPAITSITASPQAFNSTNGGQTSINYVLDNVTNGHVTLNVTNTSTNTLVRTIPGGTQSTGTHNIIWNGKDNSNAAVPEGYYTADISAVVQGTPIAPTFLLSFGSSGTGNGQFIQPFAVAVNSTDFVYVTDLIRDNVQVFDANGNFITTFGAPGSGNGQFNNPTGIGINSSDFVYVSDGSNNRVQVFDANGNFLNTFGTFGSGDGQFQGPAGIAFNSSGFVYVTDLGNNRVQVFDANGNFLTTFGTPGSGNGQFNGPWDVAVNSTGFVYVSEQNNNRVQVFDANGNFLNTFGTFGSGNGQFFFPLGIDLDSAGNVYVVDANNGRAQVFDANGNFLTTFANGQLSAPLGIAVNSKGFIYIANRFSQSVALFSPPTISAQTSVLVDNTQPVITISVPANGGNYILNQPVLANWKATDALSGIASATGTVPNNTLINTATVGQKSFTVTATDNASNQASKTSLYNVTYVYGGVGAPLSNTGTASFKLGKTISVKFQLKDFNGNFVSTATARLFLNNSSGVVISAPSQSNPKNSNLFKYDASTNQYVFTLDTHLLSTGVWTLRIRLDDGTEKLVKIQLT